MLTIKSLLLENTIRNDLIFQNGSFENKKIDIEQKIRSSPCFFLKALVCLY